MGAEHKAKSERTRLWWAVGVALLLVTAIATSCVLFGGGEVPSDDEALWHVSLRCPGPAGAASEGLPLDAEVVATGIPGATGITQVGRFREGSPIFDRPAFAAFTAPGAVLDPSRILVTSSWNFGAPLAQPSEPPGSILSISSSVRGLLVPAQFAGFDRQPSALNGAVQVFAAQSPTYRNAVNNPGAVTKDEPAVSLPLSISLNNGFGRPWFANAPRGAHGAGTVTVVDPTGVPLAGAPFATAGGVFSGTETNRTLSSGHGIAAAAVATALLTKSPDGSGRAVFAAALADGSLVQVHVGKGVDDVLAPGSFSPLPSISPTDVESADPCVAVHVGMAFNWVPDRFLLVTDPKANRILRVALTDDGTVFAGTPTVLSSPDLHVPVDLAPTSPETANPSFASGSTLGGGSDVYVLNRGNNSIVRLHPDGSTVAKRFIRTRLHGFRAQGVAVAHDGLTIWVAGTTPGRGGAVLALPAFGAPTVTAAITASARSAGAKDIDGIGAHLLTFPFGVATGLGPLFNDRSCVGCHNDPIPGGMGSDVTDMVTRVARVADGVFDRLDVKGGPIARMHSVAELGVACTAKTGIPAEANATSIRNAMTLRGTALIDAIADADIVTNQAAEPAEIRGTLNRLGDGRIGRFGWKAQSPTLVEFMSAAMRDELAVTNPLRPKDLLEACGANDTSPETDAVPLQALTVAMNTINPPQPTEACLKSAGATVFERTGCAGCHTPSLPAAGKPRYVYSDLLLHDMGSELADGFPSGVATGTQWRTTPLWRLAERNHFLHDGRTRSVTDAINAHGGQAQASSEAFGKLGPQNSKALLEFLGCI